MDKPAQRIAVIAFEGMTPFHLSVPCLVFGTSVDAGPPPFEVVVCASEGKSLRTSAGFAIAVERDLSAIDEADIVVMPAWHEDCRRAPPELIAHLQRAHARGARMVGLCLGAFPVAQAGLLDGKRATTHWELAHVLARFYPKVKVDREVLYVDEGKVLTSGGMAAGLDCCLHLLRELRGAELANRVARRLLIAPHRQGGQAQFIEQPLPSTPSEGRFSEVLDWVLHNLAQPHSIDTLAGRAAMSRRNFTRHFRQATGTSFKQWLLSQRLAQAQRMLECTNATIEVVADEAGFGTALSLRQHFRTNLHTSPSDYRKQFRAGRVDIVHA
ncbi:GlxA family transcriptional regulator [Massilia sp. Mn16-1_5]|uniref:GlxA family transcriptional regulator n=1 Tax=Massilia sp. Mn16-1_5 TaxID=2079199 RepID=UPI00109E99DD|nr:helix-turn-helix domain-containing protein [Massilia sp. Mn16-1_5]THC44490.1 AraC family transcriptional regulator [Massilia sp. Mn16-1_5]